MSHDSDKEMDVLMRRNARRSTTGLAGDAPGAKPDALHMDADELSAYAEGALPDASRSHYMLHLADCDSCRKIVTELVLSSGVEAKERGTVAQTVETTSRSWREWLAALFSPPVLRYAAPVLALAAFASIIFVVITRNRDIPSLAQRQAATEESQNRDVQRENEPASSTGTSNSAGANQAAPANTNAASAGPSAAAPASQASRETGTTTTTTEADGANAAEPPKAADLRASAPPPPVQESASEAKQTQPAQAAPPLDKASEAGKSKGNAGFINQNRRESNDSSMDGSSSAGIASGSGRRSQSTEVAKSSPAAGATADSAYEERQKRERAGNSRPATTAARARRDTSGADEESSATRTVAGKRFRQQNGVWVDTSYNSSRSAMRVRRGSEQYRALVADEPIIGTVSNSLSGAVIVVVGGRAYHIY